jgi:hypothetical protein
LRDITTAKSTKLHTRVTDHASYTLLSAVSQSVCQFQQEILYQGLQKDIPWMVWMMEFEAYPSVSCCDDTFQCHLNSVSELTEPAHSDIYLHLCDKNGLTLNICEHDGGIGMTTRAFLSIISSCGQCKFLARNRCG